MRKLSAGSILAMVLFASGALAGAPGAAKTFENVRDVPIEAVFFNPCCEEDVQVSGNAHILVTKNVIHIVVSGMTGVGLQSGGTYSGQGASVETNIFYSREFEGTLSFQLRLANDDGCAFKLKVLLHLTVDANGEVAAEVENVHLLCPK